MPEPARLDPARPLDRRRPAVGPVGPARPVGRLLLGGRLGDPGADLHADLKRRVRIPHPQAPGIPLEVHPQPPQARLDPAQVVGIVGTDPDLQQPAPLGRPQRQLLAAVGGGETRPRPGRSPTRRSPKSS
jgi:hypothetical protein